MKGRLQEMLACMDAVAAQLTDKELLKQFKQVEQMKKTTPFWSGVN